MLTRLSGYCCKAKEGPGKTLHKTFRYELRATFDVVEHQGS